MAAKSIISQSSDKRWKKRGLEKAIRTSKKSFDSDGTFFDFASQIERCTSYKGRLSIDEAVFYVKFAEIN